MRISDAELADIRKNEPYREAYSCGYLAAQREHRELNESEKFIVALDFLVKRERIRAAVIVIVAFIIAGTVLATVFFSSPTHIPGITYTSTVTDASGYTTTTKFKGNTTITTVTDNDGRKISANIRGGGRR